VTTAALQLSGSSAAGGAVAITVVTDSPNTLFGDCNNGNVKLKQDTNPAITAVLTDSVVSVATWQACGSSIGGGVGAINTSLLSPNTVIGDCKNGNIFIGRERQWEGGDHDDYDRPARGGDHDGYERPSRGGYHHENEKESASLSTELVRQAATKVAQGKKNAGQDTRKQWATRQASKAKNVTPQARGGWSAPWDVELQSLASAGAGAAVTSLTWQACGSDTVFGAGVVLATQSPSTVLGDCDNANVWIDQEDPTSIVSLLDNSRVSLGDWQVCGSTAAAGVGAATNIGGPNTVFGNCNNANTVID
jgi:hypothetical protein